MKDSGILLLTCFVALTAGCIGYGLGDGLARYENATNALVGPDRLQWEVILTGLTALAGGALAYLGSTARLRHQRKIAADDLNNLTDEVLRPVRIMLREQDGNRAEIAAIIKTGADGTDILKEMIRNRCREALEELPEISIDIANAKLLRLRRNVVFWLRNLMQSMSEKDMFGFPYNMNQVDTAIAIYTEALENHSPPSV